MLSLVKQIVFLNLLVAAWPTRQESIMGSKDSGKPLIKAWIFLDMYKRVSCAAGSVVRGVHLELLVDHQPPAYSPYSSFWKVSMIRQHNFMSVLVVGHSIKEFVTPGSEILKGYEVDFSLQHEYLLYLESST